MTVEDITAASATELSRRLRARDLSAVEVFDAFVARVEALNPKLNALIRFGPRLRCAKRMRFLSSLFATLIGMTRVVRVIIRATEQSPIAGLAMAVRT